MAGASSAYRWSVPNFTRRDLCQLLRQLLAEADDLDQVIAVRGRQSISLGKASAELCQE